MNPNLVELQKQMRSRHPVEGGTTGIPRLTNTRLQLRNRWHVIAVRLAAQVASSSLLPRHTHPANTFESRFEASFLIARLLVNGRTLREAHTSVTTLVSNLSLVHSRNPGSGLTPSTMKIDLAISKDRVSKHNVSGYATRYRVCNPDYGGYIPAARLE